MSIWQPEPSETLLARTPVRFATGAAMTVKGMRWFRDTERRDIQSELPGWPDGPSYTARTQANAGARNIVKGALIAVGVIVGGILTSQGGSPGGGTWRDPSDPDAGSDTSHDRPDEIEDFPVMWAAPGTVARTLPWQLDPGRVDEKKYTTHAIVTDRRLVIVGLPVHKDTEIIEDEMLWEVPRSAIAAVERKNFKDGWDIKFVFKDGSWCRLQAHSRSDLTEYLIGPLDLIPLESLPPAHQATARAFAAAQLWDAGPPTVTRYTCGCYRIAVAEPTTDSHFGISGDYTIMDAEGTELEGQALLAHVRHLYSASAENGPTS
ncbi:hypothetical protein [Streptomyces olivaceiscleroticus]|uniref:Tat pathway signal sequence domain protein n=1 Tax=Streptomyces olivaceiscleroticus TaxID=68245 RepID=A0ABN0ZRL0_9ACTN